MFSGAHTDVLRVRGAVEEVPRTQTSLLALHEEQALAGEHEEVLLGLLAVVQPVGLSGPKDGNANSELRELGVGRLELAAGAEVVMVEPPGVAHVHDEPALGLRCEAGPVFLEARFLDHGDFLPHRVR